MTSPIAHRSAAPSQFAVMSSTLPASDVSEKHAESLYVIPAADPEKIRLGKQYELKKILVGWNAPIPQSVDLSKVTHVLDVACGTCAWTVDLATQPLIRERLPVPGQRSARDDSIHLFACDIETKFFPDKSITDKLGITTFQHDITRPFPDTLQATFDLVHVSFLFLCLTKDGWQKALRNCYDVLKPGGFLLIDEADPVVYSDMTSAPPEDAEGHDLEKCLQAPGWVSEANRIYAAFAIENGFFVDMTFQLSRLLRDAGFDVIDTKRVVAPAGRACHTLKPELVENGLEDFSVENLSFIFEHLGAALLAKGKLCMPDGSVVTSSEELKSMVQDVKQGFREDGGFSFGRYCVAKKMHK
ncbi:hypothetical protein BN946_scf184717.g2 [Trametes cinnabarina]|uniref:Methyltransferase type 12 domain-containing protein n=1 Tax=Pycnoporus cinnabarinus TaxID=5643 RepID=A0A060SU18_PYCCI|nr:hypothetical protein BN946_scf184717.g2 [Trametes cinnabarina]